MTKLTMTNVCLIAGRAERLLRAHRDRITDPDDVTMLEDLSARPYDAVVAYGAREDVLDELATRLGLPDIGSDVVDARAFAALAEAYEARDAYVAQSMGECGLGLVDPYEYEDGFRVRVVDRDRAAAWREEAEEDLEARLAAENDE